MAALQAHAGDGRLTDAEVQTRVQSARTAVTRGDLAPLFADLPAFGGYDVPAAPAASSAPVASGASGASGASVGGAASAAAPQQPGYGQDAGRATRGFGRTGYILVSITPFIALILFFLSSWVWGFAYSWLWFLLVPIVGVIVYGGDRDRR